MPLLPDLTGRVALVTGASRGIGAAIALALADAGADAAVNYRHRSAEAESVAAAITAIGHRAMTIAADVSDSTAVTAMVSAVTGQLGAPDILVNNAGIALKRGIDELSEADFDETIAVNLKSVFLCTQAVLPHMRAQGWGRIVNISSGAARGAGGVGLHYNASKAGVEGMTRGYAARLVKEGITVNAVAPSLIDTDMVRSGFGTPQIPLDGAIVKATVASSAARIPLGRFGTAEEVAQAVLMLIGNAYMTGQTVALSGGMSFN
jgi:3-oxoacyl-[acyl-carrier protein] reductase